MITNLNQWIEQLWRDLNEVVLPSLLLPGIPWLIGTQRSKVPVCS